MAVHAERTALRHRIAQIVPERRHGAAHRHLQLRARRARHVHAELAVDIRFLLRRVAAVRDEEAVVEDAEVAELGRLAPGALLGDAAVVVCDQLDFVLAEPGHEGLEVFLGQEAEAVEGEAEGDAAVGPWGLGRELVEFGEDVAAEGVHLYRERLPCLQQRRRTVAEDGADTGGRSGGYDLVACFCQLAWDRHSYLLSEGILCSDE